MSQQLCLLSNDFSACCVNILFVRRAVAPAIQCVPQFRSLWYFVQSLRQQLAPAAFRKTKAHNALFGSSEIRRFDYYINALQSNKYAETNRNRLKLWLHLAR
jgi:hypothetical protein